MIPAEPTSVRVCWGQNAAVLAIESVNNPDPEHADLFAALAKWLRDHPGTYVGGVNVCYDSDGDYLTVTISPKPISDDPIKYIYGV